MMRKNVQRGGNEQGQSLVEMAVIVPFLLILLVAVLELSQAFVVYIGLVNSTREGAAYASLYPEVKDCANPPEDDTSSISDKCVSYSERIKAEIVVLNLDVTQLNITRPSAPDVYANCPITVTLSYTLTTFSSSISLPLVGRLGLPSSYQLRYVGSMPIREADEYCPF